MMLKMTFLSRPDPTLVSYTLPGQESIYVTPEARNELDLLAHLGQPPAGIQNRSFVLAAFTWDGGGFHYYYDKNYGLRNYMLAHVGFRPYDEAELAGKLDDVRLIIVRVTSTSPTEVREVLSSVVSEGMVDRLLEQFVISPAESGGRYVVLRRKSL